VRVEVAPFVRRLARLPGDLRAEALSVLSADEQQAFGEAVAYDWNLWARPEQLAPDGDWDTWIMLAGRGGGKSRSGSEQVIRWQEDNPLIALMAKDAAMVRDVMIEGESGILARCPPWIKDRVKYDKTKLRITFPNGAMCLSLAAEAGADAARGRQFYKAWAEEIAAWPKPREAWNEGLGNAVRLGQKPQIMVTTTPKGAVAGVPPETALFIADLCLGPKDRLGNRAVTREELAANRWSFESQSRDGVTHRTVVVRWRTEANADNLAPGFAEKRRQQYGDGSRIAAQELDAEILEKVEGALWTVESLESLRRQTIPSAPMRTVVAVDPTRADSPVDECGIVTGVLCEDGHAYVLEDKSLRASPDGWLRVALDCYYRNKADALVYEKNRMGETVRAMVRERDPKVKLVEVSASDGKRVRAEPVSALYEQGKVHHVGFFPLLEDEMISWSPDSRVSPNRMDALVWLVSSLLVTERKAPLRLV
jgi:phage terminase large subunit-like protein